MVTSMPIVNEEIVDDNPSAMIAEQINTGSVLNCVQDIHPDAFDKVNEGQIRNK